MVPKVFKKENTNHPSEQYFQMFSPLHLLPTGSSTPLVPRILPQTLSGIDASFANSNPFCSISRKIFIYARFVWCFDKKPI